MASAGKPGIVSNLVNAGRVTPEKTTNPEVAPDLTNSQNFPELNQQQVRKRKKSLGSSPTNQPSSKRKGNLPKGEANNSKELKGQANGETSIPSEENNKECEESAKEGKIMAPKKARSRGSFSGSTVSERIIRTRSQTREREAEVIDVEAEMETIVATTDPPSYLGDPVTVPTVGPNWQEYALNPTYSGNFNQYTLPRPFDLTRKNEVRDSHYFWEKYKDKIAPDRPNNEKAYMDSFGKIQGIQDSELRDKLQDPAYRSGIYVEVLQEEIEEAITDRIETTLEGMKEKTKDDYLLLEEGKFAEYHEKMIGHIGKIVRSSADAVTGLVIPRVGGSTEYHSTKIQDSQIAINKVLVKLGEQEERVTKLERTTITKDEMITWTKSYQNSQEGLVVKKAPWAANVVDKKTPQQKKIALVGEINKYFKTVKIEPGDIKAIKASTGGGAKYGDMLQIFLAKRHLVTDIMNAYFGNLIPDKRKGEVDEAFRNAAGRWERYKSMAEIENGKKFGKLKDETYPKVLKKHRETWESSRAFQEEIDNGQLAVAEKIPEFRIPVMHSNRAKNLGADCIVIRIPKNPTKQQKIAHQERYVEAVANALRWEEWFEKMEARKAEDQKTKSEQYAKMLKQIPKTAAGNGTGNGTMEVVTNTA